MGAGTAMKFRMLTDETDATVYGEHSIIYEIKTAPKGVSMIVRTD